MSKMLSKMIFFGLLTISAAYAQSSQPIQAKVPFAFAVGNTTLPAGNYQLAYSQSAHILSIRGLGQHSSRIFANALPADDSQSLNASGRLVFQCYGGTCYLAQVWSGTIGGNRGLRVRRTKRERDLLFSARAISITIPAK